MICHSRLPLLYIPFAWDGVPIGSMSGWLRMLQFPLDSQKLSKSRTATFS